VEQGAQIVNDKTLLSFRPSSKGITRSRFGPLDSPQTVTILPLTVFIGPQGTGKSWITQLIYFFRNWEYLLAHYGEVGAPETLLRSVIERLRSGRRALANAFLEHTHNVIWEDGTSRLSFSMNPKTRKIQPLAPWSSTLKTWLEQGDLWRAKAKRRAIFIPAERTYFSRFINFARGMLYHEALPITMREFSELLQAAEHMWELSEHAKWPEGAQRIWQRMTEALSGAIRYERRGRFANMWQWVVENQRAFEIEMASSGQMAGWPLFQALIFTLLANKEHQTFSPSLLAFHVEEPELHLHPKAQRLLTESLLYMVNEGFPVLVTTHSLLILRTINLALQRYQLQLRGSLNSTEDKFSAISPDIVAVYMFVNGKIHNIMDHKTGFVDETKLGDVADAMGEELYNLWFNAEVST